MNIIQQFKKNPFATLIFLIIVGLYIAFSGEENPLDFPTQLPTDNAKVVRVIDGDTLDIRRSNDTQMRVRIQGIDTLEPRNQEKQRKQAQRLGMQISEVRRMAEEASNLAKKTLNGKSILLSFSGGQEKLDPYGRLLAYVSIEGMDFGAHLIEMGLAEARWDQHTRRNLYEKLQEEAERKKLGMHAFRDQ